MRTHSPKLKRAFKTKLRCISLVYLKAGRVQSSPTNKVRLCENEPQSEPVVVQARLLKWWMEYKKIYNDASLLRWHQESRDAKKGVDLSSGASVWAEKQDILSLSPEF